MEEQKPKPKKRPRLNKPVKIYSTINQKSK